MESTPSDAISINYIMSVIAKRRWFIILPFCLAMIVGIALSIFLPKEYEAGTLILVRPANVPDRYVQAIVSSDIETRINTISQQILSRTNLERVISQFNLFSGSENRGILHGGQNCKSAQSDPCGGYPDTTSGRMPMHFRLLFAVPIRRR